MGWLSDWFHQTRGVVLGPVSFFQRFDGPVTAGYAAKFAATSLLVMAVLDTAVAAVLQLVAPGVLPGLGLVSLLISGIGIVVGGLVGMFVSAAVLHVFVYLLGGRGLARTLTVVAYATAVSAVIGWIPVVNLFALIYAAYVQVRGIEQLHGFSLGRAVAAFLAPLLVLATLMGGAALAAQSLQASVMADLRTTQQQAAQESLQQARAGSLTVPTLSCDAAQNEAQLVVRNSGGNLDLSSVTVTVRQGGTVVARVPGLDWSQRSFAEPGGSEAVAVPVDMTAGATYQVTIEYQTGGTSQTVSAGECVAR